MKRTVVHRWPDTSNLTPRSSTRLRLQQSTVKVLDEFKYMSVQFAAKNINHHHLRLEYLNLVAEICRLILRHVEEYSYQYPTRSTDTWREALEEATKLKLEMSEYVKGMTSSFGRSISKLLNNNGGKYPELIQSYAQKIFHSNFIELNFSQQQRVFLAILRQTSKTNLVVVSIRRWCGKLGIVFSVVTVGILLFNISVALRPTYTHISRAVALGFGASSRCVGRELRAEIDACGGPVGVFLGGLIGGLNVAFVVGLGNEGLLRILSRLLFPASTSEFHMPLSLRGYRDMYSAPIIRTSLLKTSGASRLPTSRRRRSHSAPLINTDCMVTELPVRKPQRSRSRSAVATTPDKLSIFNVQTYRSTVPASTSLPFMSDGYPAFPRRFRIGRAGADENRQETTPYRTYIR